MSSAQNSPEEAKSSAMLKLLTLPGCQSTCKQADGHYKTTDDQSLTSTENTNDVTSRAITSSHHVIQPSNQRVRRSSVLRDVIQQPPNSRFLRRAAMLHSRFKPSAASTTSPFAFDVGATVQENGGRLGAFVVWEKPDSSRIGGKNRTAPTGNINNDNNRPLVYMVHWGRETCVVDAGFPDCMDPGVHKSLRIVSAERKMNVSLSGLTYNSRYFVQIDTDEALSTMAHFTTRGCHHPFNNFRQCECEESATRTEPTIDAALIPNVTCLFYDVTRRVGGATLQWLLHDMDGEDDKEWNSVVSVRYPTVEGGHAAIFKTQLASMEVQLLPDKLYEIRVHASRGLSEVVYEPVYVNVSAHLTLLESPSCSRDLSAAIAAELVSAGGGTSGLLVAMLTGLSLIAVVTLVTIVFARRCCHGYAPIKVSLLGRAASLNRNIYRTSPRALPRLVHKQQEEEPMTLQLMTSCSDSQDTWELDANDVTLGVELGQGAFGIVMTGRYRDTQVAIKVVKDAASPCHREELLREIALMKQLGPHAHVVSLLGACTAREPIALIMEYMPYGNLQAFLQMCRVEGDLQRTQAGARIGFSPLDHYSGHTESWSITSTDMLSFARQVAVAMEFLSERKYVHCDLAARNVLVGPNKVVKLCDFGLARLVHTGDEYFKLTNGRLPLKWMALESIRDRVFTAQTDVWSYGVLLWEIATFGSSPYSNIALVELYHLLCNGYRLERPANCSIELYDIMSQCWCEDPSKRSKFTSIRLQLEKLLSQNCTYLDLYGFDCTTISESSPLDACCESKKTSAFSDRPCAESDQLGGIVGVEDAETSVAFVRCEEQSQCEINGLLNKKDAVISFHCAT